MFDTFKRATLWIKLLWISLLVLLLFSLINGFYLLDDRNGWTSLVGLFAIATSNVNSLWVYIVLAGVTIIIDIIRMIINGVNQVKNGALTFFNVMTIIQLVVKAATIFFGIVGHRSLVPTYEADQSKAYSGVGSSESIVE
ncbi:hypothetical protein BLNAU_10302 [Blattamonas nauphoetae]|uniref:Uncharacterized protein n=1 Tax=Blattamonas nauphoetae TaxID=2049346 RepID=A0ABQ9XSA7_9EUKA|nr:hypothetical protein BLNAU_10302 [Blattamonas nauphoetae]